MNKVNAKVDNHPPFSSPLSFNNNRPPPGAAVQPNFHTVQRPAPPGAAVQPNRYTVQRPAPPGSAVPPIINGGRDHHHENHHHNNHYPQNEVILYPYNDVYPYNVDGYTTTVEPIDDSYVDTNVDNEDEGVTDGPPTPQPTDEPPIQPSIPSGTWVNSNSGYVPDHAIVYESDENGNSAYYCQVSYQQQVYRGRLKTNEGCYVKTSPTLTVKFNVYQVLVSPSF